MAQITIYLDDDAAARLKRAANAERKSVSRWIANLVEQRTAERWPARILQLAGQWEDFPSAEELRAGQRSDAKRAKI